ncbi:YqgE/AlgH family protein [Paludibaculum fermentans]|uniref:YqgE/AlgH family protein n=1 Tax=Paludibaculum fermentans TaxID=1473598 RepID=A0A7S7NMZ9_PALFE|nr:YqgE/AlgH family protein [Paludibaculum fermentans]QOY86596.1 YqgE/AlgH family protein [Paludibaculum fermentans]
MPFKLATLCLIGASVLAAQDPQPGTLLIASPQLRDEGFTRTVILIIQNDGQAVRGLVLNRPLGDGRFAGGPVASGFRSLLRVRAGQKPPAGSKLVDGVYLLDRAQPASPDSRTVAGYTGWSSAQLKDEIRQGLWRVMPAKTAILFDPEAGTLWQRLTAMATH